MMKRFLGIVFVMALAACGPNYKTVDGDFSRRPKELDDCKFYELRDSNTNTITVVRCPLSETTAKEHRKNGSTTVTIEPSVMIDGVEYVKKQ